MKNEGKQLQVEHTVQVTSFGGAGTTMLLEFLQEQGVKVPQEFDSGIWKHLPEPPCVSRYQLPSDFRAVYLTADPIDALLSVFRRGYHMAHAVRMQSAARWPGHFLMRDEPDPPWGLHDFLAEKRDCFGIYDQFKAWTTSPPQRRGYQIMLLKYERLWNHIEELYAFLGLPPERLCQFPAHKERMPNPLNTMSNRLKLLEIYGDLAQQAASLPDVKIY
ncbi:MAG: hypothetical protein ACL93V_09090 [Candidatus Electrothrix sp. YB6]